MSYPATFEADYVERRNRLTTFFRLILAIPVAIWLALYAIVADIVILIAWFAIVFTAHYPRALYDFVAGYTRLLTRLTAYVSLLCDPYPPFSGAEAPEYPVRLRFDGPYERYTRWKTLLRIILAIPIVILRYVMELLLKVGAIAAWFVILVIGRMPRGLFDVMVLANSYMARSDAYLYLLTETYPPFQDEQTRTAGQEDWQAPQEPTPPPTPPSMQPPPAPMEPPPSTP